VPEEESPWLTPQEVAHHFRVDRTSPTFVDRVFSYVEVSAGCWWWTGTLDRNGYGVIGRGARGAGNIAAHLAVWQLLMGPIPEGMTYDHLCRNHACVSPEDAEIVTLDENKRRGYSPAARYARRTACGRGHPLDGVTTRHKGVHAGEVVRYCKTCARARAKVQALGRLA
jgi:hypothetical protein